MKISKSFKVYIHIFVIIFLAQQLLSETNYSKNIVVHKEPLDINKLKFKDFYKNYKEYMRIISIKDLKEMF